MINFGKRYEDDIRVIFHQWQKLHLGLDALSNQKILQGIYFRVIQVLEFNNLYTYLLTYFDIFN